MAPSPRSVALGTLLVLAMLLLVGIASGGHTGSEVEPQAQQPLQNGSVYWIGQQLEVDVGTDDEVYEIRRGPDDRFVREALSRDGTLSFGTDTLPADDYRIEGPDNALLREFELARQVLEVTYDRRDDEVTLYSNRASFQLEVTSDGLDAETLEEMMPASQVDDDRVVFDDATGDMVFELDTDPMPRGTYTLDFHPSDALANATLTFTKEPRATTTTRTTRTMTPTTTTSATTTTPPPTTTSTTTETTSTLTTTTPPTPSPTTTTPPPTTTTTTTTPGFGISLALLAIIGAALLALRRKD